MTCALCGSTEHTQEFHDMEILNWLSGDPPDGDTNGRAYYAFKRRERKKYPGIRADVWWMIHNPTYNW